MFLFFNVDTELAELVKASNFTFHKLVVAKNDFVELFSDSFFNCKKVILPNLAFTFKHFWGGYATGLSTGILLEGRQDTGVGRPNSSK